MSISVILVDSSNYDRGMANALSFQKIGVDTYFYNGDRGVKVPDWYRAIDLPEEFSLLLLHDNDEGSWQGLERYAKIIMRYTGGNPPIVMRENEYWIRRRSINSKDTALIEDEARQIIEWAEAILNGDSNSSLPSVMVMETYPENIVAVYLLARAISLLGVREPEAVVQLLNQRSLWGPIFGAAREEFRKRTARELMSPDLDGGNAEAVADEVGQCLKSFIPRRAET